MSERPLYLNCVTPCPVPVRCLIDKELVEIKGKPPSDLHVFCSGVPANRSNFSCSGYRPDRAGMTRGVKRSAVWRVHYWPRTFVSTSPTLTRYIQLYSSKYLPVFFPPRSILFILCTGFRWSAQMKGGFSPFFLHEMRFVIFTTRICLM